MARSKNNLDSHFKKPAILLIIGLTVIGIFWLSFISITTKNDTASRAANFASASYVPGQIIIKVKSGYTPNQNTIRSLTSLSDASIRRLHKDIYLIKSSQIANQFRSLSSTSRSISTSTSPDKYTAGTITKLKSNTNFLVAEADAIARYHVVPNDEYYIAQKPYFDNMGMEQAWDKTQNGKEVVIGVLDSGITAPGTNTVNPDLANRMWVNIAEKNGAGGVDDDGNGYKDDIYGYFEEGLNSSDNFMHGTHVAGIIGAEFNNGKEIAGVCPQCRIMSLKSADSQNNASLSNTIAAASYAILQKNRGVNIVAINHSYGFAYTSLNRDSLALMKQTFTDLKNAGIVSIVSAGNEHQVTTQYPALFTNEDLVFTVVAVTRDGVLAGYSNYGMKDYVVDFAAPGTDNGASGIISLKNTTGSIRLEGTSMAAPHVTGLIGLMFSLKQDLTYAQIKSILSSTTDNVDDKQLAQYKGQLGFGRIHAGRAISKLIADFGITQPTATPIPATATPVLPSPTKITTPGTKPTATPTPKTDYTITLTNPSSVFTYTTTPLTLPVGGKITGISASQTGYIELRIYNSPIGTSSPIATQKITNFSIQNGVYSFSTWFTTNISTTGQYMFQIVPYNTAGTQIAAPTEIRITFQNTPTKTPTPTPRSGSVITPTGGIFF